jgi:hypothetical protein
MKKARDMDISCRHVKQIWKYLKDHGCEPIIGKETALGLGLGEPISKFKEAVESEIGILKEVDTYDWITFLPMAEGSGAYNCSVFTGKNAIFCLIDAECHRTLHRKQSSRNQEEIDSFYEKNRLRLHNQSKSL